MAADGHQPAEVFFGYGMCAQYIRREASGPCDSIFVMGDPESYIGRILSPQSSGVGYAAVTVSG